jgi:SnoaL-like domain
MNSLERLEARAAICDAKALYCRALDTRQWDLFSELLTEDFVLDVTEGTELPVITGRARAVAQIRSSLAAAITAHQVHSPEFEFAGDEALVTWAMQDRVVWGPDRPSLVGYGHYHERWVLDQGRWKLAALRLTRLHLDFLPPQVNS